MTSYWCCPVVNDRLHRQTDATAESHQCMTSYWCPAVSPLYDGVHAVFQRFCDDDVRQLRRHLNTHHTTVNNSRQLNLEFFTCIALWISLLCAERGGTAGRVSNSLPPPITTRGTRQIVANPRWKKLWSSGYPTITAVFASTVVKSCSVCFLTP